MLAGQRRWQWSCFVNPLGPPEAGAVQGVTFLLHESFKKSDEPDGPARRTVTSPPFVIHGRAWGTWEMGIEVKYATGTYHTKHMMDFQNPYSRNRVAQLNGARNVLQMRQRISQPISIHRRADRPPVPDAAPAPAAHPVDGGGTVPSVDPLDWASAPGSTPSSVPAQPPAAPSLAGASRRSAPGSAPPTAPSAEACVICLDAPRTHSLVHGETAHLSCCASCAPQLKDQRCPLCREMVTAVIRTFI